MSLRHIVLWKLAAEDADTRALHAQQIAEKLLPLTEVVPGIQAMQVGPNVAYPQSNWDVALIADFDDAAALDVYQEHPAHKEAAAFIRSVVSDRACVDTPV